jgi:hypothetical protein
MSGPYYQPGRYWGRVTRQRLGTSSTGKPQLILSFVVKGKINPADPEGDLLPVGAENERTTYRSITDKTQDWVLQELDTLKWYGTNWQDFDENSSAFVSILGNEYPFSCLHKQKLDGTMREDWSVSTPATGPRVKELEADGLKALQAMFGKVLKGRKPPPAEEASQPEPRQPAKPLTEMTTAEVHAEASAETEKSDIPF